MSRDASSEETALAWMNRTYPGLTPEGRSGLCALLADPGRALIAVDFDGTLAPIVPDPEQARALPAAVTALADLATLVGTLAVLTGRPARTAVEYAALDQVPGVVVLGHYGRQRWQDGKLDAPPAPEGLAVARERLPSVLAAAAAAEGTAERARSAVMFCGDDLGDRPAFAAVRRLRREGTPGVAVCSGSAEVTDLAGEADLVVDGPPGIAGLLAGIAAVVRGG